MRWMLPIATAIAVCLPSAPCLRAAEPKVETVVDGLHNPCAVAVQPETGVLFVADSGAGRIVRVVDGQIQEVVVGFERDVYGKGPKFEIGPLGLAFLDQKTLVVGGGDLADGDEQLRIFALPEAGSPAIQVGDATATWQLPAQGELPGEGNFYGLAASRQAVFVTCNGDDAKGWIARAQREKNEVTEFKRFLPTKEATGVDAPIALTLNARGQLVVGQGGEVDVARDSWLTFYNAQTGKLLLNLKTGLHDITGLAFSENGKQLFATDFAWIRPADGGLFQLLSREENGKQAVNAKKIVALERPSALAITDGAIYVTVFGTPAEGSEEKSGKLLKIVIE